MAKAKIRDIDINTRIQITDSGKYIKNMICINFSVGNNDVCLSFIEGKTHQIDLHDNKHSFNIKTDEDMFLKVHKSLFLIKRDNEYKEILKKNVLKLYKEVIKIYESQN